MSYPCVMTHVIGPDPRFTQPSHAASCDLIIHFPCQVHPSLAKSGSDRPALRTVRSTHSIYRQNYYALDPVHAALCPMRVDLRMLPLLISIYVSLLSLVFKPLYFVYISSVQISTRVPQPSLLLFSLVGLTLGSPLVKAKLIFSNSCCPLGPPSSS